jgi:uncharacterized protein with HEPN domain
MRPEERDAASLWDALQAAKKIVTYVAGLTFDEYMVSAITRSAVEREVTIIGEALNRLSATAAKAHDHLPLAAIVGLRNRAIHEYDKVEHERIFSIATELVPELIAQLEKALPPIPPDPEPETY